MQEAKHQSKAASEVHAEMYDQLSLGIIKSLLPVIQGIINDMVELNFGESAVAPRLEVESVKRKASFDEMMKARKAGIKIDENAWYDVYGLPRPLDEVDLTKN